MVDVELADSSAWWWSARAGGPVRSEFDAAIVDGRIATCDVVRMELLHGAPSISDFRITRADLAHLPNCPISAQLWSRAIDVYDALAAEGRKRQRSIKHPTLLVAAAAEAADIPVLHYDEDFDRIAVITGQPMRWLASRGSLRRRA
jgi:predicted nucleic acid-binding protein